MNQTQLKKKFDKQDFDAGAPAFKIVIWYFTSMFFFRSGLIPFSIILVAILRLFGAKIGKDTRIKPYVNIKYPWKLQVGDHSWISECHIENLSNVSIGKNVCLSQGCMILTGNHDFTKTGFDLITKDIILGDGTWIGARAIVCAGVTTYSHAVLTVNSVATRDLEAYSIYRGNPAIKIKDRQITA
jgi:putative colanic acid biosynthesis acetyltransferase WcaF